MADKADPSDTYGFSLHIKPDVDSFFDEATNTFTHVLTDPSSKACAIIDSVLDFDYAAGRLTTLHADRLIEFVTRQGLDLQWLIETHVHADHLSAAPYIQSKLGGKIGIGENIITIQETFGKIFNEGTEFQRDGSQFDRLFADGDTYRIGDLHVVVLHTPGHTPACMTHIAGDAAFVGDTLFMPDGGTARADFPGGDAHQLYRSIQKILSFPDEMRLFMCHDYGPDGRKFLCQTTVADERANNIHVGRGASEDAFVTLREARDATLDMPALILPSLQVNMKGGRLPESENNGKKYLRIPLNCL